MILHVVLHSVIFTVDSPYDIIDDKSINLAFIILFDAVRSFQIVESP